jgi:PAS domain S-box-containing protein
MSRRVFGLRCALAAGGGTFFYELLKETFLPWLSRWGSHALTISFATVAAVFAAHVIERRAARLHAVLETVRGRGERIEAALQAVVEAIPAPAFLVDRSHTLLTLNQALATRFRRSIEDIRGRNPFELLSDQDLARARTRRIDEVFETGLAKVFDDVNGGRHYANHMCPVRNSEGEIWAVGVVAIDMTDLREAEAQLGRKEELLRFGLHAAHLAVWEWDLGSDTVIVSPQALEMLGGRPREWRGAFADFLGYVEASDRPRVEASLRAIAGGAASTESVTFRTRALPNRATRWFEVQGRLFVAPQGRLRMVGTVGDATARVQAERERLEKEDEIMRLNAGLERRVAERTTELTSANRELEAFSYSVSHDLRSPLRSIDGFALALLEDHGDQLEPEARQYLDIVRQQTQRMGQIIDDLIGLARLTRSPLRTGLVDVSALCAEIVGDLRRQDPQRIVDVTIAPGMSVVADANLLHIALENLIGNAWKFTSRTAEPRIAIGISRKGAPALPEFHVSDNGAGFDPAHASKLFQPFARLHAAAEYEGTGIGLATVARIIKRHGGAVWAESHPGEGATLRWTLPQAPSHHRPDSTATVDIRAPLL